jgi:glycosyltransferase involved in cell wall biosynthesis
MLVENPLFYGGGEIHAYELSKNLASFDQEVDIIQLYGFPRKCEVQKGVPLEPSRWVTPPKSRVLGSIYSRILWAYGYSSIPTIYRQLLSRRYDVLHVHGFGYASLLVSAVLARKSYHPKIVCTLHNDVPRHIDRALIDHYIDDVDAFIAVSQSILNEWQTRHGVKPILIPNGIDTSRFNPAVDGTTIRNRLGLDSKFVVLSIGRLSQQKGLKYLIHAISKLKKEIPNLALLIGGRGEQESYLKKLTKELRLENIVRFLGFVPSPMLPEMYAACDVFVLPSVFETFGLTLLEALSVGKPIVASRVGGAGELAERFESFHRAKAVEPEDPKVLADAILWYFRNGLTAEGLKETISKSVADEFSWEKIAERTLNVYRTS